METAVRCPDGHVTEPDVQWLPCKVDSEGPTRAGDYLRAYTVESEGVCVAFAARAASADTPRPADGTQRTMFRGRLLVGKKYDLREHGACLVGLKEAPPTETADGGTQRVLEVAGATDSITCWNHDAPPSVFDRVPGALEAMEVADAVRHRLRPPRRLRPPLHEVRPITGPCPHSAGGMSRAGPARAYRGAARTRSMSSATARPNAIAVRCWRGCGPTAPPSAAGPPSGGAASAFASGSFSSTAAPARQSAAARVGRAAGAHQRLWSILRCVGCAAGSPRAAESAPRSSAASPPPARCGQGDKARVSPAADSCCLDGHCRGRGTSLRAGGRAVA